MTDLIRFLGEVKVELSKVLWASVQELVGSVIIVFVLVCIFSIYLGAIDLALYRIAEKLFGA